MEADLYFSIQIAQQLSFLDRWLVHSCWFENIGNGKFTKHILPAEAQFAPVNSIVCTDIENDGKMDLLLGGNEYQAEVMTGRYDASYGCYLKGDGKGNFLVIKPVVSGFILKGDIRDMKMISILKKKKYYLQLLTTIY